MWNYAVMQKTQGNLQKDADCVVAHHFVHRAHHKGKNEGGNSATRGKAEGAAAEGGENGFKKAGDKIKRGKKRFGHHQKHAGRQAGDEAEKALVAGFFFDPPPTHSMGGPLRGG